MRREWEKYKDIFTTTWGADWYYIRKMQGIVNQK